MADDFETAFAGFLKDEPNEFKRPDENAPAANVVNTQDPPPVVLNADGSKPTPVAPAVGEKPAATAAAEETEIELPDPANPEPEPEPEPEPQPQPQTDNDALTRLADMLAQRQPQPQQQRQPAPQPLFNAEDQNFLTQYMNDFPDVARAERLMRQAEYGMLATRIYNEVAAYFAPKLALLDQLADGYQMDTLVRQVPDYDTVRDKVVGWVKQQPAYLQTAYNHVIQAGTPDEIADLIGRYRQATGTAAPSATSGDRTSNGGQQVQPPVPAKAPELSPQAKQAAQRLAPVSGKRSAPTQAAPQTFDDAFDAFAKAG